MKILLFLLTITIFGCGKNQSSKDSFSTSKIVNSSDGEIIIDIQYDRTEIEKIYGKNSYRMGELSMENYPQISFDKTKLISKVKLKPKDSLLVEYVNAERPKFEIVKKIKIYSVNKELFVGSRKELTQKFIEKENGLFMLEIQ